MARAIITFCFSLSLHKLHECYDYKHYHVKMGSEWCPRSHRLRMLGGSQAEHARTFPLDEALRVVVWNFCWWEWDLSHCSCASALDYELFGGRSVIYAGVYYLYHLGQVSFIQMLQFPHLSHERYCYLYYLPSRGIVRWKCSVKTLGKGLNPQKGA